MPQRLLREGAERRYECTRAKRYDKFPAIVHRSSLVGAHYARICQGQETGEFLRHAGTGCRSNVKLKSNREPLLLAASCLPLVDSISI